MPSISSCITALVAFLAIVDASPVELQKRRFSLNQVHRKFVLRNGAEQRAKTLRKYGHKVPANILKAARLAAPTNGTAPAVPVDEYDSLYLTPVLLGNTTVQLDIDTGSADLWTFSSLQASAQLTGHEYYRADPAKKVAGASWRISYGDGSGAAGTVYADKVVVGGVTATSQAVEAATSVSAAFQRDADTDGLLGLSFSSLNTIRPQPAKTFFDNVKDKLDAPVFTVTLKYHAAGTYDFGFIDKSKYKGEMTWVDVDSSKGFWQFDSEGYIVGSNTTVTTRITAIGDTGTTLIYLPNAIISKYYSAIPGSEDSYYYGGWVFPCAAAPPDFTLIVKGTKQRVPGKHINYAPVTRGGSTCYGGLQSSEGLPFGILGDVFLKSKVVVHDHGAVPRMGFADQVGLGT
ncbi:acid protease [Amniculicola lignicola CBS 123094]|uniref:Acid protease n=1 Tax=Amniculicola lignicola CBS 123094 TaxID=1392246 RepID=A0A6A5WD92_9PLEO|nr:acid protease [Amniculicola lignicola CBS 123094]